MAELGLCVVGPGGIAGLHLEALAAIGATRNAWVVGSNAARAEAFASTWGFAHATTELGEALADPAVELVVIASPSALHAPQARAALAAGKHVIVEIPVALSGAEAEQLAEQARSAGRRLLVCHTMRSFPAVADVRERTRAGELSIAQIAGTFAVPRRHNQNWTGGTRNWVDNLLWHHGCHVLDASLWMLGDPRVADVSAHAGRAHPDFGMTIDLSVTFSTAERQLVTHVLSYNTRHDVDELQLITDDELLLLRSGALTTLAGEELVGAGGGWSDLGPQDEEMIVAIVEGRPSRYDVDTVLPAMRLLDRAQKAAGSA
jgi:2-hydroxy-4-carboxymuconate semialdehyde hemiacetal dehydrogenase